MFKKIIIPLLSLAIIFTAFVPKAGGAQAKELNNCTARAFVLADADTGTIINEKEPQKRLQIASMVKIMTLNLIYDEIESGNLNYDSDVCVSEYATSMGGSQAFLDEGANYKAGELIKSIIVASANDSCVALAEKISGSVDNFVQKMNEKAKEWEMNNTHFVNCTGLPAPNQYCSALDVLKMSRKLFEREGFYDFSTIWNFDFPHPSGRTTQLTNTNKLSRFYLGCDGGKTGFTNEAKSCLSATAKRGDTRLICVVIGAENSKTRNKEVSDLLNFGFANYESKKFLNKGQLIEEKAKIIGGKVDEVGCVVAKDLTAFGLKGTLKNYEVKFIINSINAPINERQKVGCAVLCNGENEIDRVDLVSKNSVAQENFANILENFVQKW